MYQSSIFWAITNTCALQKDIPETKSRKIPVKLRSLVNLWSDMLCWPNITRMSFVHLIRNDVSFVDWLTVGISHVWTYTDIVHCNTKWRCTLHCTEMVNRDITENSYTQLKKPPIFQFTNMWLYMDIECFKYEFILFITENYSALLIYFAFFQDICFPTMNTSKTKLTDISNEKKIWKIPQFIKLYI